MIGFEEKWSQKHAIATSTWSYNNTTMAASYESSCFELYAAQQHSHRTLFGSNSQYSKNECEHFHHCLISPHLIYIIHLVIFLAVLEVRLWRRAVTPRRLFRSTWTIHPMQVLEPIQPRDVNNSPPLYIPLFYCTKGLILLIIAIALFF